MRITDYFYNIDYFITNSDNIKIESGVSLKTVAAGVFKIKNKFPFLAETLDTFRFLYTAGVGNTITFQLVKDEIVYWYSGGWIVAAEDNLAESNDLAIIQTNISSLISASAKINIIIYIDSAGTNNFSITEMSIDVDSGINIISDVRKRLLEVTYKIFPDYMINNILKEAEELIKEQLGGIIDFSGTIPATVKQAALYLTFIMILESIYYEQIKRGETINDIVYWRSEYDKLIEGIRNGSLIPGLSNISLSNETSRQGYFFGFGKYGRSTRADCPYSGSF